MRTLRNPLVILAAIALLAMGGTTLAQDALFVDDTGYVGVGTSTPGVPLEVVENGAPANTLLELIHNGPARIRIRNGATGETWNIGHQTPSGTGLVYSDVGDAVSEMLLDVNGNLTIAGTLTTAGSTYPDYVFSPGYELPSLDEVRSHIQEKGHLPGVTSAGEVAARGGINVSELQIQLLEKVEELMLYTLEQQDVIRKLNERVASLEGGAESCVSAAP